MTPPSHPSPPPLGPDLASHPSGQQWLAADAAQGWVVLKDPGPLRLRERLHGLSGEQADPWQRAALALLLQWQTRVDASALPVLDGAAQHAALQGFELWCVQREHAIAWSAPQAAAWAQTCELLLANAAAQPQCAVHGRFHAGDLCVHGDNSLALLSHATAVRGPVCSDLAALLRDGIQPWDEAQELDWAIRYWEAARKAGLPLTADFGELWRQFELTGLQQHLVQLGALCRRKHEAGEQIDPTHIARLFAYAGKVATRYAQLGPLTQLLRELRGALFDTGFSLR